MDPDKEAKYILTFFLNWFGGDYTPLPWYRCWYDRNHVPDALGSFFVSVKYEYNDRIFTVTGSFTRTQYDEGANREIMITLAGEMHEVVVLHMYAKPGWEGTFTPEGVTITAKMDLPSGG